MLTKHEGQQLPLNITATKKVQKLVELLKSKGPQGGEDFVKALYKSLSHVSGHKHLINLLQEKKGVTIKEISQL